MSRRAFALRWLAVLVLAALGIGGWVHGIYWAGGINQPGNGWTGPGCQANGCMPWQAGLIDFAPLLIFGLVCIAGPTYVIFSEELAPWLAHLTREYRSLPSARELRERRKLDAQAQLERDIARLERELGLGEEQRR